MKNTVAGVRRVLSHSSAYRVKDQLFMRIMMLNG